MGACMFSAGACVASDVQSVGRMALQTVCCCVCVLLQLLSQPMAAVCACNATAR